MQPDTTKYVENTDFSGFFCINVAKMDTQFELII